MIAKLTRKILESLYIKDILIYSFVENRVENLGALGYLYKGNK